MKLAILNAADTGATESTAFMLEQAGYEVRLPTEELLAELRRVGLENVLSVPDLVRDWGYAEPRVPRTAGVTDMHLADLFVDTKAHVNHERVVKVWQNLKNKVLWLCLNGGDPMKRTDGLPWADPPCPVLTHNQWYKNRPGACVCFPPYRRSGEVLPTKPVDSPICLVHNVARWGYGGSLPRLRMKGVRFYGGGDGNECLLPHAKVLQTLASSQYLLHLKKGDTVGYAMVEAMDLLVPFVCTQEYVRECRLEELLVPGKTCLTFDPENPDSLEEVNRSLANARTILALDARNRYRELAWQADRDLAGFLEFLGRHFA